MAAKLESCVIRVCDANGKTHGTGFLVSHSLAVTCAHVVKLCSVSPGGRVHVVFYANGESGEADVLSEPFWKAPDADDVAVLRLLPDGQALPLGVTSVTLGSTRNSDRHSIRIFGFPPLPGGYDTAWADGKIRGVVPHPGKRPMLQMDAQPIRQGMSGAPVLDLYTERVIGMVSEFLPNEPLEWATTSDTLAAICDELKLHPPQAVEDYLEGVKEYYQQLPYVTLNNVRSFDNLEEGYFQLPARLRRRETEGVHQEQPSEEPKRDGSVSIAQVMQDKEHAHVLILGEPGVGKSILLRQLALRAWTLPETIGLNEPHLPILVSLRQFAGAQGGREERLNRVLVQERQVSEALPKGFFTDWPLLMERRWLILLDALDEVPEDARRAILEDIRLVLRDSGQNRIVITSRPSAYIRDDFDKKMFGHYDLLSFTPGQIDEFAREWFGNQAVAFLQELERVRAGALNRTPLLLTIAAKIYLGKHTLPERRSRLYEQFVNIWLEEAEERELKSELGERVTKVARSGLARLALAMTERAGRITEGELVQVAAGYLGEKLRLSEDEAESDGKNFVQVMARRSGIFVRRGTVYDWVHPTFREYLAAEVIVRECQQDLKCVWNRAVARWAEENWREVSLFALNLLSDAEKDVTALVERIRKTGDEGLYFAGDTLAEQVRVTDAASRRIIDGLLKRACRPRQFVYQAADRSPEAIAAAELADAYVNKGRYYSRSFGILSQLRGYSHAAEGLLTLVRDKRVHMAVRGNAILVLGWLGRMDTLLALVRDKHLYYGLYREAAEALAAFGSVDDLLALELDGQADWSARMWAAAYAGDWRRLDVLLALAQHDRVDLMVRMKAAMYLCDLGHVDEVAGMLLAVARHERLHLWEIRIPAVIMLARSGRGDDLLALVLDERVNGWVRGQAAEGLGRLGRVEDLLALARDGQVNTWVRRGTVSQLGRIGNARVLPDLEQIAREDADQNVRGATQEAIEAIRRRVGSGGEGS